MILHIPLAADAFYEYLDLLEDDQEAPIYFALYADLRHYGRACTQEELEDSKYDIAKGILDDYLEEESKFFVKVNKDVERATK